MVYLAIFIGGALGSLARFLLVDSHVFAFSPKGFESLIAISFVNLLGALVLGFVNNTSLIANNNWKLI